MASAYIYRFSEGATWGIYIELTAEAVPLAEHGEDATHVTDGLWLAVRPAWLRSAEKLHCLAVGLRLVERQMQPVLQRQGPLVVRVVDVVIAPADYQDEGLACAIAGWLAEHYRLDYSPPPVRFDREQNRYQFSFPEAAVHAPS